MMLGMTLRRVKNFISSGGEFEKQRSVSWWWSGIQYIGDMLGASH